MKEKILKLITAISVIIVLTSINVLFLGYHIVIALANELETQGNNTNITDVQFDAYFKVDNGNTHYRQANITDDQIYLYININVLEKGSVNNAKIKINDSNFKIKENNNLNANTYVKNIDLNTNEIELNSIIYNNSVEIEIPIEFNKIDNINSNYFSKETNITLEGIYKEEEDEKALEGKIITKLDWTDNAEVTMFQTIEKCIDLGEKGILLQQGITTTIENGSLPRETEKFNIAVPKIGDILPTSIDVLINGTKIDGSRIQYNEENGQLFVEKEIAIDNEGNCSWDSGKDEYKIIYMYDQSVRDNLTNVTLHTEMNSKLFTKENIVKTDEQEVGLEFKGNIVSSKKSVTQEIYKGYLYANSVNETTYKENNVIEISNAEVIDSIYASTNNSYFVDGNENTYDANDITIYKETLINKNRFIQLFGENGYIHIKDANGNVIYTINNQSETDETGNIHITYGQSVIGITFETSKPVEEGQFTIHNVKAIQGNTGYTKNQLKRFTKLNTNEVVTTNRGTDIMETGISLLDTTTEAKLELSTTNFSTLQMNENVQITVTLKTSSEKYDLFKNPVIELTLPNSISNISVNSVNKVYADEFDIAYARLRNGNNGEKIIQIALSGEQSDYSNEVNELTIVVNANIEFNVLTASQTSNVLMTYTNENGNEGSYQTAVDIHIQSKPGMMIYNNISGFNTAGDSIYTIDDNIPMGVLEVESGVMTAKVNTAIINNYDTDVKDSIIIGRIPKKGVNDGTIDTTLVGNIHTNLSDVEILYSANATATQEDDSWSTDATNAASYMIRLDTLTVGQAIAIQYEVTIPENVGYGQSIYAQIETTYTYLGNVNTQSSTIGAKSENVITNNILALASTIQTEQDGLGIAISAVSGGSELKEGTPIYEGQMITYTMQITNNTGVDLHNINAKAIQTNGHLYDLIEEEAFDPNDYESTVGIYHKYNELDTNEKTFDTIDSLANGESVILQYNSIANETEDASAQTSGSIHIQADELEETIINTISNPIQQAELKAMMKSAYYEEEELYIGMNLHMNLKIENISGNDLRNAKGTIQLPEGIYLRDASDLIWNSTVVNGENREVTEEDKLINSSYDQDNNVLTFEISNMEPKEITTLELYVQVDQFEEREKEYAFMYQLEGQNIYVSNMATIKIINTQRNVTVEQYANIDENVELRDEDVFDIAVKVENHEAQDLYFQFYDDVPDGFTVKSGKYVYKGAEIDIPIVTDFSNMGDFEISDNILSGLINVSAGESLEIILTIEVDAEYITEKTVTNTMDIVYGELAEDSEVYLFDWYQGVPCSKDYQVTLLSEEQEQNWVEVSQTGNPENNAVLENGQEIIYTFDIKNTRNHEIVTTIYDYIPKGITVQYASLNGQDLPSGDIYVEGYRIDANSSVTLEIIAYADIAQLTNTELVNNLTVSTVVGDVTSNDIVYRVISEETPTDPDNPDNPDNPEDPDNPDNPDNPEDPDNPDNPDNPNDPNNPNNPGESEQYTISGTAWIDSNRDGRRDSSETVLSGVGIRVVDANQGTYVDNVSATTSANGQYQITVGNGNYILVFSYDIERYNLTEYRKEGVSEDQNSDVISRNITIDGTNSTVGATDMIRVNSGSITNIDIGLTEASIFDLELDKYVNEVIVQTKNSTTQYGYNDQTLVKVEIPSKELNNATVIIKYAIKITNVGEVAGYVQNIVDYIPSDLTFNSELNADWYQANSNLQNNSLSNTPIKPGETQTIDLVLVKTMNNNNTGTVINIAEIGEASNILELRDMDSIPNNNNASEDDYGRAEIIISVGTGKAIIVVSIIFVIVALITVGIFVINKKVLSKDDKNL